MGGGAAAEEERERERERERWERGRVMGRHKGEGMSWVGKCKRGAASTFPSLHVHIQTYIDIDVACTKALVLLGR